MFTQLLAHQPAGPDLRKPVALRQRLMIELWNQLLQRLRHRAARRSTCCGRFSAARSAPRSACCPASARRSPWRCCCRSPPRSTPTASMIFFAGIYYGAMYGGSTTSILLNTPGETASMVTAMEGNKMAKSGRAGAALATAAIGSFVAGTIATVIVTLFAPVVADVRGEARPARIFPADGAGLHHRQRGARQEHAARPDRAVRRPGGGPGGHRPDFRPGALHRAASPSCWTASRSCWWRSACSLSARRCTRCSTRAGGRGAEQAEPART